MTDKASRPLPGIEPLLLSQTPEKLWPQRIPPDARGGDGALTSGKATAREVYQYSLLRLMNGAIPHGAQRYFSHPTYFESSWG